MLYNTISEMIQKGNYEDGQEYKALIIDCGGGTTDLCSCSFRIWDRRVAYQIEMDTSYENGDTDFGGNNLTYRIMQLIKIAIVNELYPGFLKKNRRSFPDMILMYSGMWISMVQRKYIENWKRSTRNQSVFFPPVSGISKIRVGQIITK